MALWQCPWTKVDDHLWTNFKHTYYKLWEYFGFCSSIRHGSRCRTGVVNTNSTISKILSNDLSRKFSWGIRLNTIMTFFVIPRDRNGSEAVGSCKNKHVAEQLLFKKKYVTWCPPNNIGVPDWTCSRLQSRFYFTTRKYVEPIFNLLSFWG